jgi:flagellar motility protein MotE (MotC chaperone)
MVCNLLGIRHLMDMLFRPDQITCRTLRRLMPAVVTRLLVFGGLCLLASRGPAQEAGTNAPASKPVQLQANENGNGNNNGNNGKAKGKSKPTVAERPQVIGAKSSAGNAEKGKPDRPGNPNATDPAEVTSLVTKFQSAREGYLAAQKELNLKKKDATEEQRAVLRDKVKEALDKWKEEHKQFVEEQKERSKEMKQELQSDLGKVVDGAGEGGGKGRDR